jgi:hypothetical protein
LNYRFKEFEELYKKEQIMKDSEARDDIEEIDSNIERKLQKASGYDEITSALREGVVDGSDVSGNSSNPHRKFCNLGSKIFSLIDALAKFQKIGLIDTGLKELYYTFKHNGDSQSQEFLQFNPEQTEMQIKFISGNSFLEDFQLQLNKRFETCRSDLHSKYQESKYANLTYFYGPRLYDLTNYMID